MKQTAKDHFVKIIEKHQGIILMLCRTYYPDRQDQEDIRQDIILQLWKSFPTFRNESKISTWIYKVALHTILYKIRSEQRKPVHQPLELSLPTKGYDCFTADDDLQQLKYFIASLRELDKAIVLLYLEGYQYKEIGQILEITATNVSTRLCRVKNLLKQKYKNIRYDIR